MYANLEQNYSRIVFSEEFDEIKMLGGKQT